MSREFLYKSSGSSNRSIILSYVTRSLFSCQIYCFSTGTAWTAWKIALDSYLFFFACFSTCIFGFLFRKRRLCMYIHDNIYGRFKREVLKYFCPNYCVGWDYDVNLDELLIRSGQLYIFCQKAVIFAKSQYS